MDAPKSPADLTQDQRDAYEERAAILQYDAKHTRQRAEQIAWGMILAEINGGRVKADM